ncbi:MAG: hypothetical protein ABI376_10685 [Caulobacteraceae bacterium]
MTRLLAENRGKCEYMDRFEVRIVDCFHAGENKLTNFSRNRRWPDRGRRA